jgi:hypothetical protein
LVGAVRGEAAARAKKGSSPRRRRSSRRDSGEENGPAGLPPLPGQNPSLTDTLPGFDRPTTKFVLDESLRPPADLWMELDLPTKTDLVYSPHRKGTPAWLWPAMAAAAVLALIIVVIWAVTRS